MEADRHWLFSRIIAAAWLCVATGIWSYLAQRGLNYFFSAAMMSAGAWVFMGLFVDKWPALKDGMVRFGAACALVLAFFLSSILSGDWGTADNIPFTCIGTFHIHHWFKSMLCLALFLQMPSRPSGMRYTLWTWGAYLLVLALWILAQLSGHWFPYNRGLVLELRITGLVFLVTALMIHLGRARATRWFWLHVAICAAVECGVFANGLLGIIRDSNQSDGLPGSFIFFDDATCQ